MALTNTFNIENWKPKTELGRKVKNKEITDIGDILDKGQKILEPEVVDVLLPDLSVELLEVGQSKGKFGGGKGSIWKQTQKKTFERLEKWTHTSKKSCYSVAQRPESDPTTKR